jgi:hypothetical protein
MPYHFVHPPWSERCANSITDGCEKVIDAKRSQSGALHTPLAATRLDIRSSIGLPCHRTRSFCEIIAITSFNTLSLNAAFEPVRVV